MLARAEAIARAIGAGPAGLTELAGGNMNHVVRATGGGRDLVVRFAKDPTGQDRFDAEAWCLRAAERAGIRTSALVARGELSGVSYLVVDFLDGVTADAADAGAWHAIGAFAAGLARIDVVRWARERRPARLDELAGRSAELLRVLLRSAA